MSVDPLADLAVAAVFDALAIPITYRPRLGEPAVVQAVQVRPPPALDVLGGGRVAHDGLIAQIRAADLARPPAEGDQAIIEERRYRVRSARWAAEEALALETLIAAKRAA